MQRAVSSAGCQWHLKVKTDWLTARFPRSVSVFRRSRTFQSSNTVRWSFAWRTEEQLWRNMLVVGYSLSPVWNGRSSAKKKKKKKKNPIKPSRLIIFMSPFGLFSFVVSCFMFPLFVCFPAACLVLFMSTGAPFQTRPSDASQLCQWNVFLKTF